MESSSGKPWSRLLLKASRKLLLLSLCLALAGCAGKAANQSLPRSVQARMDLAQSYLQKDRPRHSLNELYKIKSQADGNPDYHFLLGLTQMELKKYSAAADEFERALEVDPDFGSAWNNLGLAYLNAEQFTKAEEAFHQALDIPTYLTPEYAAYNLARLAKERSRPEAALKYCRRAQEFNWRYGPVYFLLSELLVEKGQIREAVNYLRQGVKAQPENAELWLRLAENQLRLGHSSDAIESFQHIVEQAPESEPAEVARDYLGLLRD